MLQTVIVNLIVDRGDET